MELTLEQALQKGIEAHKAGKVQEADRYYTAILKAQPKHPDANHNMGVLAVGVGKVEEALPFFKTALEANQSVAQYWLSHMDALIKLDRIADAKSVFEQARSKGAKGDGFDKLEKRLNAITTAPTNTIIEEEQDPPQDQLVDIINCYNNGQFQEVLDNIMGLTKKFPSSAILHNIRGASFRSLRKFDESLEAYNQALALKPDYAEAHYNLGNVLKEQGKLDEAIAAYKKVISLKSDYVVAHYNLGNALKDKGELDKAVEAYTKALSIKPDYAEAYNNMGLAYQDHGQLELAIEAYNKAISLKPDNAESFYNLGIVFKEQGMLDKAIEVYQKALSIRPDYAAASSNMGDALKDQGKLDEAIQAFEKSNDQISIAKALECTYLLGNYDDYNLRLNSIAKTDPTNIRVAAISAFAANQRQSEDVYPFCTKPIELIKFSHIKTYVPDADSFIANILIEMNEKKSVWEPKNKTTKGGFQTNNKLFAEPSPNMKILEDIFKNELNLFKAQFNNNESSLFQKWPDEMNINAWYVRMFKNGHQDSHIHPTGWVSGVFYLKTVESPVQNEGAIEFGLQGYDYPVTNENYPRRLYQPVNGDLVLFPSSLFHKTIPVLKDVERCVIAFDLVRQN